MSKRKIVYIAGPFRAKPDPHNQWVQERNIRNAEAMALEVCRRGAVALCPHSMFRNFQGALPDAYWLEVTTELLRRCDAIMLIDRWLESEGSRAEFHVARDMGLEVFYTIHELDVYLESLDT